MSKFLTEQENFWAGEFGNNYIKRNMSKQLLASNINFFSNSLKNTYKIKDCIEFGSNIGMNLKAIGSLYPNLNKYAIEINNKAIDYLKSIVKEENIFNQSILDFNSDKKWDLVLIKGVLIHINPTKLDIVYEKLFSATRKYLLICEYYNPNPISLDYRGNADKLFKRDFAGEILSKYNNLQLLDYGFVYHNDNKFPQDDITWFLLKNNS